MKYSRIVSTGSYLPPRRLTNADLATELAAKGVETSDEWIVERTGIRARHFAACRLGGPQGGDYRDRGTERGSRATRIFSGKWACSGSLVIRLNFRSWLVYCLFTCRAVGLCRARRIAEGKSWIVVPF